MPQVPHGFAPLQMPLSNPVLRDKVALVTGASGGVGGAVALALAAEGCALHLVGRDADRLAQTEIAARMAGANGTKGHALDLESDELLQQLQHSLSREAVPIDILVHSGGAYHRAEFAAATPEEFDRQYRVNLRAAFLLTQFFLPQLRSRQSDIVFINSTQGLSASATVSQFAATQHGLTALADALRLELSDDGVRVLSLHLGRTATPRQERIFATEGRRYEPDRLIQPEDVASIVVAALRLPRRAQVMRIVMGTTERFY
jgi:NADP-dependent 3-hydroxy acid dehydrogenase YdfG